MCIQFLNLVTMNRFLPQWKTEHKFSSFEVVPSLKREPTFLVTYLSVRTFVCLWTDNFFFEFQKIHLFQKFQIQNVFQDILSNSDFWSPSLPDSVLCKSGLINCHCEIPFISSSPFNSLYLNQFISSPIYLKPS